MPLIEGDNTLTAEATGVAGQKLEGILHVTRKLISGNNQPPGQVAGGCGCAAGGGLELIGLLALVSALRRRRVE